METVIKYRPPYTITKNILEKSEKGLNVPSAVVSSLNKHLNLSEELFIMESFDNDKLNGKFIRQLIVTGNIFDVKDLSDYFFGVYKSLAADGFYIGFAECKKNHNQRGKNKKFRMEKVLQRFGTSVHFFGKKLAELTRKRYIDDRKESDSYQNWSSVSESLFEAGFRVTDFTEEDNVLMFVAKKYRHSFKPTDETQKRNSN